MLHFTVSYVFANLLSRHKKLIKYSNNWSWTFVVNIATGPHIRLEAQHKKQLKT